MLMKALMVLAVMATTAAAQPAETATQQVVDVRDLSAAMEPARLELIVGRIGDAISLNYEWLDDGLLIVEGTPARLDVFDDMMSSLRLLYDKTYSVELRAALVGVEDAPALGARFDGGETLYMTRQSVTRRVRTPVIAQHRQSFVADVQPVVGDQAVGYDPQIEEAISSLETYVTVGAGEVDESGAPVTVRGQISQTSVSRFESGQAMPAVELPQTHLRSFNAARRATFGDRVVVAVLDGMAPGEAVVVTIRVDED